MRTLRKLTQMILSLCALSVMVTAALAADPGSAYPATSEVSDQKAGSILIYNFYNSGATSGTAQNTRVNITNTNTGSAVFAHLFFVADSCQVADSFICLTPNQTASFLASDIDPGVRGYIVVVAVDGDGCPRGFNWLIGDEYIKLSSGHSANLGAEAFAALYSGTAANCNGATDSTATLIFDGVATTGYSYNRVPRTLAVSNIASRADGNDTLVIINRIGGNLGTGASTLGTLFGLLYDDGETPYSFSVSGGCQLVSSLSNTFPRTTPRFETVVPAGRVGWMRIFSQSDIGILGMSINANANTAAQAGAFNGGHNMHKLTLTASAVYTIPIFPPSC